MAILEVYQDLFETGTIIALHGSPHHQKIQVVDLKKYKNNQSENEMPKFFQKYPCGCALTLGDS